MCSTTARPRFAAFLTSGLPATSPIRYWPGTAVWKCSSISGTLSGGGTRALGEHDQRLGRAREHARFALDAVLEAEHAALVRDQIEYVGRAHRDAGIAARAAIVVDIVDQDARPDHGRGSGVGMVALASGQHRERHHQQDGEAPERQRHDPGHSAKIPQICALGRDRDAMRDADENLARREHLLAGANVAASARRGR